MPSPKRRREFEEAKQFIEAFRLARAYGKAGRPAMARATLNLLKIERREPSPDGRARLLEQAVKRMKEIQASDREREEQGY
jgi:hypothetical protein